MIAGVTGSGKASAGGSLSPAGTTRQILQRVDRAIHIGERELRYQLAHKHEHPLADSAELLFVLAELEELGLVEAELCFRLTDQGRRRLKPPDDDGGRFAVMEDDTVLCGECVAEICDRQPATAGTLVHAWITPEAGTSCRWCGTTAQLDDDDKGVGS
ncbi:MAG: hypothetical protein ACRDZU_04945 [Acidimicrobiales bacterium]